MAINEVGLKTSPLLHQLLKASFILTDKFKKILNWATNKNVRLYLNLLVVFWSSSLVTDCKLKQYLIQYFILVLGNTRIINPLNDSTFPRLRIKLSGIRHSKK
jgi:hypothetical protein